MTFSFLKDYKPIYYIFLINIFFLFVTLAENVTQVSPICPLPNRYSVLTHFRTAVLLPPKVVGTLCAQLFQQFLFTSQVFWSWSEDVYMVWTYLQISFVTFYFSDVITNKVNRQWVPCVRNSSNSFLPIILKLHMLFRHGLKMCMWFEYYTQIFLPLFSF